ncbi:hypothetical protein G6O45_27575, partial [Salmonella enterica subsp. enterica serovar Istanbul]|nr:hypothetical protein [Salmonella enterica subsp. enterica serovar Istanbul]
VTCSEISAAGWDTTITPPFRVIELGMIGAAPATYTVTAARPGSAGDALVAYTGQPVVPDGGDAGATDLKGSAGTVTLSSVVA